MTALPRPGCRARSLARCSPATCACCAGEFGQFVVRTVMQPLLFVFVFAYVFPKIGQGFGGAAPARASFSTDPGARPDRRGDQLPGHPGRRAAARAASSASPRRSRTACSRRSPVWVVGLREDRLRRDAGGPRRADRVADRLPRARRRAQAPHLDIRLAALRVRAIVFASLLASSLGLLHRHRHRPATRSTCCSASCCCRSRSSAASTTRGRRSSRSRGCSTPCSLNPLVYISEGLRCVAHAAAPHMPAWAVHARAGRRHRRAHRALAAHVHAPRRHLSGNLDAQLEAPLQLWSPDVFLRTTHDEPPAARTCACRNGRARARPARTGVRARTGSRARYGGTLVAGPNGDPTPSTRR